MPLVVRALRGLSCLFVIAATALPSRAAQACAALACTDGSAIPSEGATVPANAVAVIWTPPRKLQGDAATLHLYRVEGTTRSELEATLEAQKDGFTVLRPKLAPPEGTELEASYDSLCSTGTTYRFPFRVGPAAPLPSELGTLDVTVASARVSVGVSTGECSDQVLATSARVEIVLSSEAQPYAALLRYSLWADGQPAGQPSALWGSYPTPSAAVVGGSHLGRGVDRVDVLCEARQGVYSRALSEGSHRLQMVALLPDGTELRSSEVTVDLRCPAGSDGGAGAAADASAGDGAPASASGSAGSAAEDSSAEAANPQRESSSGCTVSPASQGSTLPLWALSLLVFCVSAWRERRRRARALQPAAP